MPNPINEAGHTVSRYDQELAQTQRLLLFMGGHVEQQLQLNLASLLDLEEYSQLETNLDVTESQTCHIDIQRSCLKLLALRQPMGRDLRAILTYSACGHELLRISEEAIKIVRIGLALHRKGTQPVPIILLRDVRRLHTLASTALRNALNALARRDLNLAQRIDHDDIVLNRAYHEAAQQLQAQMQAQPDCIPAAIELLHALKAFERIGDHAKLIGAQVYFLLDAN